MKEKYSYLIDNISLILRLILLLLLVISCYSLIISHLFFEGGILGIFVLLLVQRDKWINHESRINKLEKLKEFEKNKDGIK